MVVKPDTSIEKNFLLWLLPVFAFLLGVIGIIAIKVISARTVISPFYLFSLFLSATLIGVIVYRHTSILSKYFEVKKLKRRFFLFLSILTFGPITTGGSLFLNSVFARDQQICRAPIVKTEFGPQIHGIGRGYQYEVNEFTVSFSIDNHIESMQFEEPYRDIIDQTEFINVKFKKGLFGYYVMMGFQFDAQS